MQIRNVGKMWRVTDNGKTLAFATSYAMASHRRRELLATRTTQSGGRYANRQQAHA